MASQVSTYEDDARYRVEMIVAAHGDAALSDNESTVSKAQHQLDQLTAFGHALDEKINELSGLLHRLQEEREQASHLANALSDVIHRENTPVQEIDRPMTERGFVVTVPNDPSMVRY